MFYAGVNRDDSTLNTCDNHHVIDCSTQNVAAVESQVAFTLEAIRIRRVNRRERPRTWRRAIERLNRKGLPIRWANRM
jgi:hypothetical protein